MRASVSCYNWFKGGFRELHKVAVINVVEMDTKVVDIHPAIIIATPGGKIHLYFYG